MLMIPFTPTSLILGTGILREGHNIFLYSPRDVHRRMACTISVDLQLAALGLPMIVEETASLSKVDEMDVLVIPTLDAMPEKDREEYADVCEKIFR
jgi:hypothetical protein